MGRQVRSSGIHRPELVTGEWTPVFSDPDLPEDCRTGALPADGDDDDQEDQQEKRQEEAAGHDVERALHRSVTPPKRQRWLSPWRAGRLSSEPEEATRRSEVSPNSRPAPGRSGPKATGVRRP